ncbi:hypothetical protein HK405_002657, partial [Cladochytrium tenue]
FAFIVPATEILDDGIRLATLLDPSGLEVRLVELGEPQLTEESASATAPAPVGPGSDTTATAAGVTGTRTSQAGRGGGGGKRQPPCRLGYVVVATARLDDTVRMYERLFAQQVAAQVTGGDKGAAQAGRRGEQREVNSRWGRAAAGGRAQQQQQQQQASTATGGAGSGGQAAQNLVGFRQVDSEECTNGLIKTYYRWLGNDWRASGTTLCFVEQQRADTRTVLPVTRTQPRVLSI